jgi:hypothetical protein
MRLLRFARANAVSVVLAGAGALTLGWLGLYGYGWNDYENEAQAAVDALVRGHFGAFAQLAPAYGGSLLERAPFAMLAHGWGGGELAVYRMLALPCLLASVLLAVWLVARMRAQASPRLARGLALGLLVANPVTLPALELGHPEELLGGCLVALAVLLAGGTFTRPRPLAAGLVLGLAIANKDWALLAVGPVLLAVPPGQRLRCLGAIVGATSLVLAPLLLASRNFATTTRAAASQSNVIFQPWQLWWFLGHHGGLVHGLFGTPKPGYRTAPAWLGTFVRPLIILCGFAVSAALWLRRRRLGERDALLALTLLLLVRCVLDTWDVVYYTIPFLVCLALWEVRSCPRRPPVIALVTSVLVWVSFEWLPHHASADAQAGFFLLWTLPLIVLLSVWLWRGRGAPELSPPRRAPASRDHRQLLGLAREHLAALLGDDEQILDPHAELSG